MMVMKRRNTPWYQGQARRPSMARIEVGGGLHRGDHFLGDAQPHRVGRRTAPLTITTEGRVGHTRKGLGALQLLTGGRRRVRQRAGRQGICSGRGKQWCGERAREKERETETYSRLWEAERTKQRNACRTTWRMIKPPPSKTKNT